MDLFRESRYIMHFIIIVLVFWLGWLPDLAFAQVYEAFTGSANFPSIGITCIGNLAAFIRFILLNKLQLEDLPTQVLIIRVGLHLLKIEGVDGGLTTSTLSNCYVVMLSRQTPNISMQRFMDYISRVYRVHSIFLPCRPIEPVEDSVHICTDACTENQEGGCGCIVFNTVADITMMLARRMPGTVKRLSDSRILLPSLRCLRNGCHGCNQGLLHVENDRLREGDSQVESPAAVCEILDLKSINKVRSCICIPVRSGHRDKWINQLITLLKPEEKEFRGTVIREGRTNASSALENYNNRSGECDAVEKYEFASLIIVPRLTIVLINLVLTFWLKVDGLSSFMLSISVMQGLPPKQGQFSPHLFLSGAHVKSNANKTDACQVLFFNSAFQTWALSGILEFFVNCICCISWMVLVALEGSANKWYHTHSMPPSRPRIIVIIVAIFIALVMDAFDLKLYFQIRRTPRFSGSIHTKIYLMICAIIALEILCIVGCSAIVGVIGRKYCGRWIYSALQCLVLIKSYSGIFLLFDYSSHSLEEPTWWYGSCGLYIASSCSMLP